MSEDYRFPKVAFYCRLGNDYDFEKDDKINVKLNEIIKRLYKPKQVIELSSIIINNYESKKIR